MRYLFSLILAAATLAPASAQYIFDSRLLDNVAEALKAGDERAAAAVSRVEAAAEKLLTMEPLTVTAKSMLPPSNDSRDYMTLSPYWWPDPEQPDGLPYIRRDGERNPEVYDYPERENGDRLGEYTRTLAVLYRLTGDERYAAKCAELLRTWFLDPEKGMNPNMTYSQLIRGRAIIRGTGIIDARRMCYALNSAQLIASSPAWSEADAAALREWSAAFLYWLEHSVNGLKELHAPNNHGLWYDAVRVMTARAAGLDGRVREIAEESFMPRFAKQVAEDGSLPEELARTLSLHYSTFALEAFSIVRNVTLASGIDIWTMPEAQRAVEYLLPYYENPSAWPHTQIKPFETPRAAVLLREAGTAVGRAEWVEAAHRIGFRDGKSSYMTLLHFDL
ncbi:MAG: alginate lyase family protein [Alistipes sp.]|nr:alginate lyase family protein [Alistipes sp.]